jgi:hypothetical protein
MRIRRLLSLIVLVLAGIGSILYGALYHTATVEETKQREISIAVPTMSGFEMPPMNPPIPGVDGEQVPGGPPGGFAPDDVNPFQTPGSVGPAENPFINPTAPPAPPGMKFEKVTEDYVESITEPEWKIVHEITFGGVVRLANGHLKRTYTGDPPSLCPT